MKKFAMGIAAAVMAVGFVALVGIGTASAAKPAKGTATCASLQATVNLKPALTPTGTSKETSTIKPITVGSCTASSSPVTTTKVTATIKTKGTNSCESFATNVTSDTITLTIKWSGVSPTTVTFKPGSIQVNNTDSGFIASGGSAKGSYATTSASFAANLASASSSALAKCIAGSGGVSSLQVTSGNATV